MVINMISYLATFALAFMAFTASAQDRDLTNTIVQFCPDSSCTQSGAVIQVYYQDLDGSDHCLGTCQKLVTTAYVDILDAQSLTTCKVWGTPDCDETGEHYQSLVVGKGGSTSLTTSGSVRCYRGVCPSQGSS